MNDNKTIRVYPAYVKGPTDEVLHVDEQFLAVWAALGRSKTHAINSIFLAGLETLMASKDLECKGNKASFAMHNMVKEVKTRMAKQSTLEFLYENLSLDEFVQFCAKADVNPEIFLAGYRAAPPSAEGKRKVVLDGLKWILGEGNPRPVEEVRAEMVEKRIIVDEDWAYVRNIASQEGYSGNAKRGYWKL